MPSLTINDVTVTEGNSGTTNAVFTVTLSAVSGQTVTVNYQTADGSGDTRQRRLRSGERNADVPGQGSTTATITVLVTGDTKRESNETFVVNLSGAGNATIADTQG